MNKFNIYIFSVAQQPNSGLSSLIIDVSRPQTIKTHTHTHSVGLLWKNYQLFAEAAT